MCDEWCKRTFVFFNLFPCCSYRIALTTYAVIGIIIGAATFPLYYTKMVGDLSPTELGTSICLCIFLIAALVLIIIGIFLADAGLVLIGVVTIGVVCAIVLILEFFYIRIFPDTDRLDFQNIIICLLGIPICAYLASVIYCFFMGVWEDDGGNT